MDETEELKIAIELAKKAGAYLQSNHGQRQPFTFKKTSSELSMDTRKGFQTKADLEAEEIILDTLKKKFPDDGFLSEESPPEGTERDRVWVIDPLSGTIAYIHGLENYGVYLALLFRRKIVLGVVNCPAVSSFFWAEQGKGAFLNGQRIKVSTTDKLEDSLISIEHKMFRLSDDYPRITHDLVKKIRRLRVGESGGQELGYVAAGKTDALIKSRQPLYDYAAGKIILEESGGEFTDFSGNKTKISLDPEVGIDFVASNGRIHNKLLEYF